MSSLNPCNLSHSKTVLMELATVGCILACIASVSHAQTCTPPDCYMNGTVETPCKTCPIGQGVAVENMNLQLCTSSPPRDTKCEPCVAGVNFSDTNSRRSKCHMCRECHSGKEDETKACTVDSNRECSCKEGLYYYDSTHTESCMPCTVCRQDQEEKRACTALENRVCGNKSTTTPVPPSTSLFTTNQTTETTSMVSPISAAELPSTGKDDTGSKALWPIAVGVIAPVFIIIIIAILVCRYRNSQRCDSDGQNIDGCGHCVVNFNFCIGKQTNQYGGDSGSCQRNGLNGNYHQVPAGSECNGITRTSNGPSQATTPSTSTTAPDIELQQSPASILGFSQEGFDRLMSYLDQSDPMGRNALMLADEALSPDIRRRLESSDRQAWEVMRMWVEQGLSREDLIRTLRSMNRDDIADHCEEDQFRS